MKQVPVHNNSENSRYFGGVCIPAGETRMLDEHLVPADLRAPIVDDVPEPVDAEAEAIDEILAHNVTQLADIIPSLSGDELDKVEAAEKAGQARKGVLSAITEARLSRAAESGD